MRVFVTGIGAISGLGQGLGALEARLSENTGGIQRHALREPAPGKKSVETLCSLVDAIDLSQLSSDRIPLRHLDRNTELTLVASDEAIVQAGLTPDDLQSSFAVLGTSTGSTKSVEDNYHRLFAQNRDALSPSTVPRSMSTAALSALSLAFGIRGLCFVVSSACASGAHAIGEGFLMVRSGRTDIALVGGTEAAVTFGVWKAWDALHAMSADGCRPFCATRNGFVLGEGAAMFVLESERSVERRGARVLGELVGYGHSSDAYHITQPSQDGVETAIRGAFEDARVDPGAGALISTHGTGTKLNDVTEANALIATMGDGLDVSDVIATKSLHGHLLGAGGALELAIGIVALNRRRAPPILGFREPDDEIRLPLVVGREKPIDARLLLSNSFAFGGLNVSLLLRAA